MGLFDYAFAIQQRGMDGRQFMKKSRAMLKHDFHMDEDELDLVQTAIGVQFGSSPGVSWVEEVDSDVEEDEEKVELGGP